VKKENGMAKAWRKSIMKHGSENQWHQWRKRAKMAIMAYQ